MFGVCSSVGGNEAEKMERSGSLTLGPPACARSGATQRHDLICRCGLRKHCFTLRQRHYEHVAQGLRRPTIKG